MVRAPIKASSTSISLTTSSSAIDSSITSNIMMSKSLFLHRKVQSLSIHHAHAHTSLIVWIYDRNHLPDHMMCTIMQSYRQAMLPNLLRCHPLLFLLLWLLLLLFLMHDNHPLRISLHYLLLKTV